MCLYVYVSFEISFTLKLIFSPTRQQYDRTRLAHLLSCRRRFMNTKHV